jgi:outer membrane protein
LYPTWPCVPRRSPQLLSALTLITFVCLAPQYLLAETLPDVLVRAYQGNPQLNAERARQRGTDEGIPQALSAYRPQVTAGLSAGIQGVRNLLPGGAEQSALLYPWSVGITVNQTLFNGLKTANTVRQSEAQVKSGREALRNVEQSVLLDAVTAYMDVLSLQILVEAQRANLGFLREFQGITRKRFNAGDVTPTDVAQAEARLSRGTADLNAAEVNLAVARAMFTRVIGTPPAHLSPAEPIDRLVPATREESVALGRRQHPVILGGTYDIDAAQHGVSIAESSLWPNVSVQGNISRNVNTDITLGTTRTDTASVIGQVAVPIYDGGQAASQTRQAKEQVTQARMQLERMRGQIENAVVAAWVTHEGARISMTAAESELRAAGVAFSGVQKEAQAGQRTTLDVLNSQQEVMGARARLIQAQRDRVVASYTLSSAVGRLDVQHLGLKTPVYDSDVHYHQVRDAWHGLRTPSGQ